MDLEKKVIETAASLRRCASRGSCTGCPLDGYVGNCTEKLKCDAAELLEDEYALIRSLADKASGMIASIVKLREKYAGEKAHEPEED